ncbi:MAG TPA: hypothetical protein VGU73_02170 [Acidimicrobiia bacterium]|nr:hypothetical protein [Acidimicrobiia bacterium]
MSALDDYLAKARAALDGVRPQLDDLKVQANLAQADAKERLQAGFAKVQQAQAKAKTQLDEASKSGQDTWRTTARRAEQTVNDVGSQLQDVAEQVQRSVTAAAPAARRAWTAFLDEWNRDRGDRERLLKED